MKFEDDDDDPPSLPEEIITEILKRLSVKTLIRIQSVCKYWKNLIKSPWFITKHLHHSTHQNPCLLFQHNHLSQSLHLRSLDCEMKVRQVHNPPLIGSSSLIRIVGSTNGLLCLVVCIPKCLYSFLLWNPATREAKRLPRPRKHNRCKCMVGFGYSPIVNDYKIVRICGEFDHYIFFSVEVYSLRTDSWKKIDLGVLQGVRLRLSHSNVSVNGSIFWFGIKPGENNNSVVVLYDIAREVFTLIPFRTSSFSTRLTVYDDKLALVYHNRTDKLIDLWVLEKGTDSSAETWSWTKKYTNVSPCEIMEGGTIWRNQIMVCTSSPMYWFVPENENDEPIGWNETNPDLDLYLLEPTTTESKMFVFPGVRRRKICARFVSNYVESLVPLVHIIHN